MIFSTDLIYSKLLILGHNIPLENTSVNFSLIFQEDLDNYEFIYAFNFKSLPDQH